MAFLLLTAHVRNLVTSVGEVGNFVQITILLLWATPPRQRDDPPSIKITFYD